MPISNGLETWRNSIRHCRVVVINFLYVLTCLDARIGLSLLNRGDCVRRCSLLVNRSYLFIRLLYDRKNIIRLEGGKARKIIMGIFRGLFLEILNIGKESMIGNRASLVEGLQGSGKL